MIGRLRPDPPPRRAARNARTARAAAAFTLVEVMMAVLIMGLLASAAALTLTKPVEAARAREAVETLRAFDRSARHAATAAGAPVRIAFDLSARAVARQEGRDFDQLRHRVTLPVGCRIDAVRVDGVVTSSGQALVDVSPLGLSRSYAVRLRGPELDEWVVVAGLTGAAAKVRDEATVDSILASPR